MTGQRYILDYSPNPFWLWPFWSSEVESSKIQKPLDKVDYSTSRVRVHFWRTTCGCGQQPSIAVSEAQVTWYLHNLKQLLGYALGVSLKYMYTISFTAVEARISQSYCEKVKAFLRYSNTHIPCCCIIQVPSPLALLPAIGMPVGIPLHGTHVGWPGASREVSFCIIRVAMYILVVFWGCRQA